MEVINKFKREVRVAAGLDGGTSEACRATFPNVQLRAVGGVSGGTKRGLPSDTFKMLDLGWLVGIDGGWTERSDSGAT